MLIRQDIANLEGKPLIDSDEGSKELQTRLEALTKKRSDIIKILDSDLFERLKKLALEEYHLSIEPPDKAKEAIVLMIKDFNDGKIDVDPGDFQVFIGYVEVAIEYWKVVGRLKEIRSKKYLSDVDVHQLQDKLQSFKREENEARDKRLMHANERSRKQRQPQQKQKNSELSSSEEEEDNEYNEKEEEDDGGTVGEA